MHKDVEKYMDGDRSILWARFYATLIDVIIFIILFYTPLTLSIVYGARTEGITYMAFIFPAFVVLYYWVMEVRFGGTIGKFAMKIKVVNAEGNYPSVGQVFLRTVTRPVEVNPFFLVAIPAFVFAFFTPKRQRLGDLISKTYVIPR
ncbi:RDD family protein [Spongorhabdus nitratireducens]